MKKPKLLIACGTTVLFAAALGLQAQTSSSSNPTSSTSASSSPSAATASGGTSSQSSLPSTSSSSSGSQSSQFGSAQSGSTQTPSASTNTATSPSANSSASQSGAGSMSASGAGSASGAMSGSMNSSNSGSTSTTYPNVTFPSTSSNASTTANTDTRSATEAQIGSQTSTQNSSTTAITGSTQTDAQVTTFVQQLDAQGPAVVQRISTQVGELACSQDTIQNLVEALHTGKSVTLTSEVNGQTKSATFNASGAHLGYGEAYLAIALAAQQLRNAGVTSCATPDQWQAVLLGGPLNVSTSSSSANSFASASGSNTVPGIITLRTQGQGWGQIAQANHIQLSQVVSNSSGFSANTSATKESSPTPTGFSSAEMNHGRVKADTEKADHDDNKGKKKEHWWNRGKDSDDKAKSDDKSSAGSHADTSTNESGTDSPASSTPADR